MDEGGGLTLETKPFSPNKRAEPMDPVVFEFPISFAGREAPPQSLIEENRSAGVMDFFSGEKRVRSTALDFTLKKEDFTINTGLQLANTGSDQSTVDEGVSLHEDDKEEKDELEAMQADLRRMTEENLKLRGMLSQVTNNYNALQMHFMTLMQQRSQLNRNNGSSHGQSQAAEDQLKKPEIVGGGIVPRQFIDLGLAADTVDPSTHSSSDGDSQATPPVSPVNGERSSNSKEIITFDGGAEDNSFAREESPENSSQVWTPNMQSKLGGAVSKAAEQAKEATMRKVRVSVRARSEAPMITDGCQWRKYGQKMAKGNPCPRAYYRCTMATGCPVRKQVQRSAEDRAILVTTYEGNHNHPLPPAAMAMSSTTSAAASMLLSGSMPSSDGIMNSNILARTILPCSSSLATISASAPFPTVTLDLTQSPNPLQYQRPMPQQFHMSPQTPPQQLPSSLPHIFGQSIYNQSKFSGLHMSTGEAPKATGGAPPHSLADTVSAATAAITADPNFTKALAAAITSIIGGGAHPLGGSPNSIGGNSSVKVINNGNSKPADAWNFPPS